MSDNPVKRSAGRPRSAATPRSTSVVPGFADALRNARLAADMTIAEASARAGMPPGRWSEVECESQGVLFSTALACAKAVGLCISQDSPREVSFFRKESW